MVKGTIPLSSLGLLMGRRDEFVEVVPRSALCFGYCGWCPTLLSFSASAESGGIGEMVWVSPKVKPSPSDIANLALSKSCFAGDVLFLQK